MKEHRKILFILTLLIFTIICSSFFLPDLNNVLIFYLQDDAFYYFKIAENFINTGSFTFDGISGTNGFHPLWMCCLIILFSVFKLSSIHRMELVLVIQLILVLVSLNFLIAKLKKFFRPAAIIIIFNCFFIEFLYSYFSGMETALVFFLYTILFCYCVKHKFSLPGSSINYFFSGCIAGLVVLARLDQIFLITSFLLYFLLSSNYPVKERLVQSVKFSAGFLCFFLPYLILNLIFTGSAMPVSGRLKSSFPQFVTDINYNFKYALAVMSPVAIVSLLSSLLIILWIIFGKYFKRNSEQNALNGLLLVFSLTMITHFLYSVLFMKWGLFSWHFSNYVFFGILFTLPPLNFILGKLKPKQIWPVTIIILIIPNLLFLRDIRRTYAYVKSRNENHWHVQSYKAGLWAKENFNSETVFAMSDAGFFSYFSGRNVINLDGLVNNTEYQEALKNHNLHSYLKSRNVKYIVHHAIWDNENVISGDYDTFSKPYLSMLYPGAADSLILRKENEVYRSTPYYDGSHKTVLLIWKFE